MDWLPYILLIFCGLVFVALGTWYRTEQKKKYLCEVSQILGFPVTEWKESCCSDCRSQDPHPYPLRNNTFCYCGGGSGGGGGGDCKGGDGAAVCILLLVFGILVSVAACLAFCPIEPHLQIEDPRRKGHFHIIYNTRHAYVYHDQRFVTLEKLRDQLRQDFQVEDEEQEGVTVVVPGEIEMEEEGRCVIRQEMV